MSPLHLHLPPAGEGKVQPVSRCSIRGSLEQEKQLYCQRCLHRGGFGSPWWCHMCQTLVFRGTRGGWAQRRWGSRGQVSLGNFCPFLACSQSAALQGDGQILLGNGLLQPLPGRCCCSALCQLRVPPAPSVLLLWA